MSEMTASTNAETGSAPSDSGTGSSVEAGEGEPPGAANDNAPQASNDNTASDNTLSGGDGTQEDQPETGMSGPAEAADQPGAGPAANDNTPQAANDNAAQDSSDLAASPTLEAGEGDPAEPANDAVTGSDASQVTTANNSGTGSPIREMKNGELSQKFNKSAVKKGGGTGGGGDGDGEDGGGDKQPELIHVVRKTDAPVGKDVAPNATQATETGTDQTEATGVSGSAKPATGGTDSASGGATVEIEEGSLEEDGQQPGPDETDGNGATKPATDGTGSASGGTQISPEIQTALDQYQQSKADPTAATGRAAFSPGQDASADRTKAQSKPNGPRGPRL